MNLKLIEKLPPALISIGNDLITALPNCEVYLVGGAVRDLLLERNTKDYDLVVRQVDVKKLEDYLANKGKVNLVGKTFGVFKWQPENWTEEPIDVALPRTEHILSGTGEYRDFAVQSDSNLAIEEDLERRDFTINAIALNLANGELIDPNNGQIDLKNKTIRAVGEPTVRFNEDLSRTWRGLRLACQLNFTIENQTWEGIKLLSRQASSGKNENGDWLVPREIIAREFLKTLIANPVQCIELMDETEFLNQLLPEVVAMKQAPQHPEFHSEGNTFEHTKLALAAFGTKTWQEFFGNTKPSLNVVLGTLLHDIGKPLTLKTPEEHGVDRIRTDNHDIEGAKLIPGICERLKLTSYVDAEAGQIDPSLVAWITEKHLLLVHGKPDILKPATIYRYFLKNEINGLALQQLIFVDSHATITTDGRILTDNLKRLRERIVEIVSTLPTGKLNLLLNGNDLITTFKLNPGPQIGELLKNLEEAQLENKIKTKEEAIEYLRKILTT